MKIFLKCEQPSYDIFTGKSGAIERTITHEFVAEELTEVLENYEMFLRGIGYHFEGRVEIVEDEVPVNDDTEEDEHNEPISSSVMNNMVHDLIKNAHIRPINLEENNPEVSLKYAIGQPEQTQNKSSDKNCSLCGLSMEVMQNHYCWDSKCPKNGRVIRK